jgi:hypothetical protein
VSKGNSVFSQEPSRLLAPDVRQERNSYYAIANQPEEKEDRTPRGNGAHVADDVRYAGDKVDNGAQEWQPTLLIVDDTQYRQRQENRKRFLQIGQGAAGAAQVARGFGQIVARTHLTLWPDLVRQIFAGQKNLDQQKQQDQKNHQQHESPDIRRVGKLACDKFSSR